MGRHLLGMGFLESTAFNDWLSSMVLADVEHLLKVGNHLLVDILLVEGIDLEEDSLADLEVDNLVVGVDNLVVLMVGIDLVDILLAVLEEGIDLVEDNLVLLVEDILEVAFLLEDISLAIQEVDTLELLEVDILERLEVDIQREVILLVDIVLVGIVPREDIQVSLVVGSHHLEVDRTFLTSLND